MEHREILHIMHLFFCLFLLQNGFEIEIELKLNLKWTLDMTSEKYTYLEVLHVWDHETNLHFIFVWTTEWKITNISYF